MDIGGRSWSPWERPYQCMVHEGKCPECAAIDYTPTDFLEKPKVPSEHTIRAPHAIVDKELERIVYSPGDLMSDEDAVKYGIVPADDAALKASPKRSRRKNGDRAKKPQADRMKRPEADR